MPSSSSGTSVARASSGSTWGSSLASSTAAFSSYCFPARPKKLGANLTNLSFPLRNTDDKSPFENCLLYSNLDKMATISSPFMGLPLSSSSCATMSALLPKKGNFHTSRAYHPFFPLPWKRSSLLSANDTEALTYLLPPSELMVAVSSSSVMACFLVSRMWYNLSARDLSRF